MNFSNLIQSNNFNNCKEFDGRCSLNDNYFLNTGSVCYSNLTKVILTNIWNSLLNFVCVNMRSIRNKTCMFTDTLASDKYDIGAFTESRLTLFGGYRNPTVTGQGG